jgi:hypothetical protein
MSAGSFNESVAPKIVQWNRAGQKMAELRTNTEDKQTAHWRSPHESSSAPGQNILFGLA